MNWLFIGSLLYIQRMCLSWKKKHHLQVFSKKLFVQWETLDYAFITGMESPQLQPLTGRISVGGTGKTVRCMFVWTHPHQGWGQMSSVLHVTALALTFPVQGENLRGCWGGWQREWMQSVKSKTKPITASKIRADNTEGGGWFWANLLLTFLRGAVPVPRGAVKYDNCRLFFQ